MVISNQSWQREAITLFYNKRNTWRLKKSEWYNSLQWLLPSLLPQMQLLSFLNPDFIFN